MKMTSQRAKIRYMKDNHIMILLAKRVELSCRIMIFQADFPCLILMILTKQVQTSCKLAQILALLSIANRKLSVSRQSQ